MTKSFDKVQTRLYNNKSRIWTKGVKMSHSIIEDLYYGKRGLSETIPISEEYKKILNDIVDKENILTKNFTKDQKNLYFDISLLYGSLQSEHGLATYIEGFKIGLRIGIECMEQTEEEKSE